MCLDIIVTHYNEPIELCKKLFDSIACQRGINFDDIKVTVINDGNSNPLTIAQNDYPYSVECITIPHGGISAARNYGMRHTDNEYFMFCDCDDMFLNNCGLHLVFEAMYQGFDVLMSDFIEEQYMNGYHLYLREKETTYIHGKVYNRKFINDNGIHWNDKLTIHEDGYFNTVVFNCAERQKHIKTAFYMWCWNENSVVRKGRDKFLMRTYPDLIDCRIAATDELIRLGKDNAVRNAVLKTILDAYYDVQTNEWLLKENQPYVDKLEKCLLKYYRKYRKYWDDTPAEHKAEIAYLSRQTAYKDGFRMEKFTIRDWLRHLLYEVKI